MANKKRTSIRRRFVAGAIVAGIAAFAAAYRFALRYRARVGFPTRFPVEGSPADFGLTFEQVRIPSGDLNLSGWFVPAESGNSVSGSAPAGSAAAGSAAAGSAAAGSAADKSRRRAGSPAREARAASPGPGVVVLHGWESNRGRTFAHVRYLHAAGFHCLVIDVRGHGDSAADGLPINVPEFADDAIAAVRWLAARPEVTRVGVLGHSMGAAGAIVAASREPLVGAVVSLSAPADLARITRKTFDMAEMNIPEPIATPLAWFTAALLLAPRRRGLDEANACVAASRYRGPLLLIHGEQDHGVPVGHLDLIARAAGASRGENDPEVETLLLPEFGHRWLYEDEGMRRRAASFLARSLGGLDPDVAGERAAKCTVARPDDVIFGFSALAGKKPEDV
jgi:alpha-beta hydrolase superfamily lysophospholipase